MAKEQGQGALGGGAEEGRPRLWFVCGRHGAESEVWMGRQLEGLGAFERRLLCIEVANGAAVPAGVALSALAPAAAEHRRGLRKWAQRAQRAPARNFFAPSREELRRLVELGRSDRPDVILAQFGKQGLRMLPVGEALGAAVVPHFHGVDISAGLNNRWYRWSLAAAIGRFAAMVCVGAHQKQRLVALGANPDRVHVIPCGVPTDRFDPSGRVGEQPCRFLAVGRLVEKKGPCETVRAFAACAASCPGSTLTVVGDGPLRDAAAALAASLGVADRVTFTGALTTQQVREQMRGASVFLQHSLTPPNGDMEGWPVAVAEAMACGLPVVATRHAAIPEQVEHSRTGYLVEERDIDGMAEAMIALAQAPELRQQLGAASRERAVSAFDLRIQLDRLERVLLSVVKARR